MFLRFVSPEFCADSECRLGIFQAAYQLLDSGNLAVHEQEWLWDILYWFEENLATPGRFSRSVKHAQRSKAICWFRPTAKVHLARIWEMAWMLESGAVPIWMLRTSRPGYIVYEDEFQVVAEPFIDLKRRG